MLSACVVCIEVIVTMPRYSGSSYINQQNDVSLVVATFCSGVDREFDPSAESLVVVVGGGALYGNNTVMVKDAPLVG